MRLYMVLSDETQLEFKGRRQIALDCTMMTNGRLRAHFQTCVATFLNRPAFMYCVACSFI